jgi:diaminopimelate decarboxylase
MTELIRPALYGARHPIAAVTSEGRRAGGVTEPLVATEVHGPVCESTDYFGEYWLPPLARGDLVAIGDVGAYASTMASTYNGRSIPAAVLWQDGSLHRVRPRGNWTSVT